MDGAGADEHQVELGVDEGQLRAQEYGADRNPCTPIHDKLPADWTPATRVPTASSHRRNPHWSWCPSSCRARTRSRPTHPWGGGACAVSTSWTAPRVP